MVATFADGLHAAAEFLRSFGNRFKHEADAIEKLHAPDEVPDGKIDAAFNMLWEICWRRSGANPRKPALLAFHRAVKKRGYDPDQIVQAAVRQTAYYAHQDPRFAPQLVTWLNQDRFRDDLWSNGNERPRDTLFDLGSDERIINGHGSGSG